MLNEWAKKWGIPQEAIDDLRRKTGAVGNPAPVLEGMDEGSVQSRIRLAASRKGWHLWRNNVGACTDDQGNFIRYGLANDSKRVNDAIKSSDLIGIRRLLITRDMVGSHVGQFVALEVKRQSWKFKGTDREIAQHKFITLIEAMGGHARFISDAWELNQ